MGKLEVVVDGQYGSCGKGAVAAYLAHPARTPDGITAVRVAGPNAGHTAVDPDGNRWALRQVPVAAVVNPDAQLVIAAGSEIDCDVLLAEIDALEAGGHKIRQRLTIDPMATILEPQHRETETSNGLVGRIGSTGKGIGAARADRIMRTAKVARDTNLGDLCQIGDTARLLRRALADWATVQVEGTQGYGLGLHHRFYPQVTSSDCRAIDFLAMAGVMPWDAAVNSFNIWLALRPYPIRVAGPSGPMRGETTWQALGLPEERTTVTQKIRRVGIWDAQLAREAVVANGGGSNTGGGPVRIALTMLDQLAPELAGTTDRGTIWASQTATDFIRRVHNDVGIRVSLAGTSDRTMVAL